MKLSDYVMSFLVGEGVDHLFLLPGGWNMHLLDSAGRQNGLAFVTCLHEQAAVIAADAFAQFRGGLGVALVTTGPGGTNAVTGIAGSWAESVPVLILSGQVKTADIKPDPQMRMRGFQEVDIVSIVRPITKYAVTVLDPGTIRYHLEKASFLARSGRKGPVWLDIPLDVQAATVDPHKLRGFDPAELSAGPAAGGQEIKRAVRRTLELLSQATRPVILAGYGIRLSKSESLFKECSDRLGVPVLTTWKACDLLGDDHPLYFGRPGTTGQRGANFILQNADFLLTIGARLDFGQIGYSDETFARGARKIIVDIDPAELTKHRFATDLAVEADAGSFIEELLTQRSGSNAGGWPGWVDRCRAWKLRYPVILPEYRVNAGGISTYVLVDVLSELLTPDDLLVPGSSGSCSDIFMQAFRVKTGQRILNSPGFGAMGFGIPQTIGACLASRKRRTVCLNGDGGFQLNIQELETVRRLDLPIKYFYLNNRGYASIRATQRNYFEGRFVASDPSSGLTLPEISRLAEAYRIPWNRIGKTGELEEKAREALSPPGPFICEVMIDPDEQVAPRIKSVLRPDGRIVSKPLEDLSPLLDRKEFVENMIVPPLPED
jgi:acetolactate synthase-1/2/3 large subunit